MSAFSIENTVVRIADRNQEPIERLLRETFPDLVATRDPVPEGPEPYDFRVLVSFRPPTDEDISHYDWIHSTGAGIDVIVRRISEDGGSPVVTRTLGMMGRQMGEYCLGYALAQFQKMALRRDLQTAQDWSQARGKPVFCYDKTIAIIGTGHIGQGIARAFRSLGARVVGYSRTGREEPEFDAVFPLERFTREQAPDVLIGAVPSTSDTRGLIDGGILGHLSGGLFINVGRGATLEEAALKAALDSGAVFHAVLDVFEVEPLPRDHWMWGHEGVTVTPHVSGLTQDDDAAQTFVRLLEASFETGKLPVSGVDLTRGY